MKVCVEFKIKDDSVGVLHNVMSPQSTFITYKNTIAIDAIRDRFARFLL